MEKVKAGKVPLRIGDTAFVVYGHGPDRCVRGHRVLAVTETEDGKLFYRLLGKPRQVPERDAHASADSAWLASEVEEKEVGREIR